MKLEKKYFNFVLIPFLENQIQEMEIHFCGNSASSKGRCRFFMYTPSEIWSRSKYMSSCIDCCVTRSHKLTKTHDKKFSF